MINSFEGKYAFLSNFYDSPIVEDRITYPTNEHYFQAMKTMDSKQRQEIAACDTPGKAKKLGRKVFLRPDWEEVKLGVMETGLRMKFSDPDLANKLIATGNEELIEGNWWGDTYWGVCNDVGENHLGKLLMKIRSELVNP